LQEYLQIFQHISELAMHDTYTVC